MASVRRIVPVVLFAAIVLTAVDPSILLLAFSDREERQRSLAGRADPNPELAAFLAGVRERTQRGDSIALLLPPRPWSRGYSAAYFRASYLLAGREVLPVISPQDEILRDNITRATYVAAWHVRYDGGRAVWHGSGGTLVRRK